MQRNISGVSQSVVGFYIAKNSTIVKILDTGRMQLVSDSFTKSLLLKEASLGIREFSNPRFVELDNYILAVTYECVGRSSTMLTLIDLNIAKILDAVQTLPRVSNFLRFGKNRLLICDE